jgi:hypothetical protein
MSGVNFHLSPGCRFGFPSLYRVNQCRVILLCLISITLAPLSQSFIHNRGIAALACDARRVSHPRNVHARATLRMPKHRN